MLNKKRLKAPFPYFGGKSVIAKKVWSALGDCKHYIEPFFGSGAVLLQRPDYQQNYHIESVCDKDGFVANVWRALQFNPDEVAKWCDWPVNHADLAARKKELIKNEDRLLGNLIDNPEWYDAKIVGYWIWASSCWIGAGLTRHGAIPHISDGGMGIHSLGQIPHIADGGKGVHSLGQIPHIADGGKGVHSLGQIPHISHGGYGINGVYKTNIYEWFRNLQERIRYVRVVCGDWTRVCGGNWQADQGICGMFFDPPYGVKDRATIYHRDSIDVASDVMSWCKERGKDKEYRIVIAGYEEHQDLLDDGWRAEKWSAVGGYANRGTGNNNRHRETLYYSPYCCNLQKKLFMSA